METDLTKIEYHGLIWTRTDREKPEFKASNPEIGNFTISQYGDESISGNTGRWWWQAEFDVIKNLIGPTFLQTSASGIVDTREEAMAACLVARGNWLDEIKMLMEKLGIGDFAAGFQAGQNDIRQRIAKVMP